MVSMACRSVICAHNKTCFARWDSGVSLSPDVSKTNYCG